MPTPSVLAQFNVTLSVAVSEPVSVDWYTVDGTAKAGVDYAGNKGTVVFAPGQVSKTVDILVFGRAIGADDRSFFVEMLPPTNAVLGASLGECIIHVDTSGSTPVTQIIVPTGPKGDTGESAYQTWLTLPGNAGKTEQEFFDSLKPSVEEIAEEVAPLINVGDTTLTAEGTGALSKPDATTVKAVARRVAYAAPARIAYITLADGDNNIPQSMLSGDVIDFSNEGVTPRIFRGSAVITPEWSVEADGSLTVKAAISGDVLYVCQYSFTSSKRIKSNSRELWRRSLAAAGYYLVPGSFESGAVLNSAKDAVWHMAGGQCYSWDGSLPKTLPENSKATGDNWHSLNPEDLSNSVVYLEAVASATRHKLRDGGVVICKGRDTANDGGGGEFRYDANSNAAIDGGVVFSVSGGGRLIRQVRTSLSENQISVAINVRWFGAKGDASTDDTAAVLAAYNFAKSTNLFYTLLFPAGRYVTRSSFIFEDVTNASFSIEGAVFIGASKGPDNSQQGVVEFRNVVNAAVSGPWSITFIPNSGPISDNNPNAYISAFLARGVPGGVLHPTLGIVAFFSVHDLSTPRTGNSIRVGEIGNDAQTSEMQFVNCKTPFSVNPVQVAGSQTIVSFVGCTLASNAVSGITNASKTTIINDGGAVAITGGSVEQHADSSTQMILMGPCRSDLYGNPYGQVSITGACIETIAPICQIANRFGYSTPSSYNGRLSIVGCVGGYLGVIPSGSPVVSVFDTTYAGIINIPDGTGFYAAIGAPARTAANIDASGNPKVRIAVGKTVFDTVTGFKSFQAGVVGGIMVHPELMGTAAAVTSQAIPATTLTTIRWGSNPTDAVRMGRYHYMVDTSTGVITVPDAGIKSLRVEASAVLDAPNTSGNIMLYRGGAVYKYGVIGGGVANIDASIPDPVAGEQISIRLNITAASALSSGSKMNIFITT